MGQNKTYLPAITDPI